MLVRDLEQKIRYSDMRKINIWLFVLTLMGMGSVFNLHAQFSGGTGTEADPYLISSDTDLNNVRDYNSLEGLNFRLMNDIDLTDFLLSYPNNGWLPIGNGKEPVTRFSGHFHGGGHKISGLWISRPDLTYVGFFGVNAGSIDSLIVEYSTAHASDIMGGDYVGGLVGLNTDGGEITYCQVVVKDGVDLVAVGNLYVGGLCGFNQSGTIQYCSSGVSFRSAAPALSMASTGGFIGTNVGRIFYCYATGHATTNNLAAHSGGFVGFNSTEITECYATGDSYATRFSGGFAGHNSGRITNCYSWGESQLIASTFPSYYGLGAGGFVGNLIDGKILNCYSIGTAKAATTIQGSNIGAFAGFCSDATYLSNCFYRIDIQRNTPAVGNNIGNANVFGTPEAYMQKKVTYTDKGWDFNTVWGISENVTYPYLYRNLQFDIADIIKGNGTVCPGTVETYVASHGKSGDSYVWEISNGIIMTGKYSQTVTVIWYDNASAGKLTVSYGGQTFTRTIVISPVPRPSITGNMNPGSGATEPYNTEAGMLNYVWTATGGNIVSGQGTSKASVRWNCGVTTGHVTVNYSNSGKCMASAATDSMVIIQLPPRPSITGNMKSVTGETGIYSTQFGLSNYVWTVTGGQIVSGQGTPQVSVKWDCGITTGHVTVNYVGQGGCSADVATDSLVTLRQPTQPSITGNMKSGTGDTGSYGTEPGMSNYVWTVTGGQIVSGQGTPQISVKWNCNITTGHVTVNYANSPGGCSAAAATDSIVTLQLPQQPAIFGSMNSSTGANGSYSTDHAMSNYVWTVIGGQIISGQGTSQISVKWDCTTTVGHVKVNYSGPGGGCASDVATDSTVTMQRPLITGVTQPYIGTGVTYTTDAGMSDYQWTVTGGRIVSGQNTREISVFWNASPGKLSIAYVNKDGCPSQADLDVYPEQLFDGGTGTTDDPFLVCGAKQLDNVRLIPSAHYLLTCDVDLTDFLTGSDAGWRPIPNFSGTFNGGCHDVRGLWMNRPNEDNLGLFGDNSGTIDSIFVSGDTNRGIIGHNYVGVLLGKNNNGTISRCGVLQGIIYASGNYIGGLVGGNLGGTIIQSYSINTSVSGNQYVGGLLGYNSGNTAKVRQCYSWNTTSGNGYVGGLIGGNDKSAQCIEAYAAGVVFGYNLVGGFIGFNDTGFISSVPACYYDVEVSGQPNGLGNNTNNQAVNVKSRRTYEMKQLQTFVAWDFASVWKIIETRTYPFFYWQDGVGRGFTGFTAIENVDLPDRAIYPNPTTGVVTVDCSVNSSIKVYTLSGQLIRQFVAKSEKETVDLTPNAKGVYVVKVDNVMHKVIKK